MDAQGLIDRRRLRRKLGFWRIAAILALVVAVLAAMAAAGVSRFAGALGPHVARVEVSGLITEDKDVLDLLDKLGRDDAVRAVIVKVNSPGGTTVGGETLFEAVRRLAEKKPVAAEVGTLAASAGYMVAMAADRIFAHQSSIVGSIGVIFQYVDASVLLGRVGVDVNAVRSTPLKAEPSPFAPAPAEAIEMIRRLVLDSYDWFVGLLAERRALSPEDARRLADGSVFTGNQGLANRLVDALGGEREILQWLASERGLDADLVVRDHEPERGFSLLSSMRSSLFSLLGLDPAADTLPEAMGLPTGRLDGLLSLWQPRGQSSPVR